MSARLLLIDNYDSFTYNLVQAFMILGAEVDVRRNDEISVEQAKALSPTHLCISPGPGTPYDAGVSMDMIRAFAGSVPVFGVCLGHQSIVEVFGGKVVRAPRLMHGKTSPVRHGDQGVFAGLPNPFDATRYHSLEVKEGTLPEELEPIAWADDGTLMGLRHRGLPYWGVQFHPESVLTGSGPRLLANFLAICRPVEVPS